MSIPSEAKTGFWVAIGVFTAMLVFKWVENRVMPS